MRIFLSLRPKNSLEGRNTEAFFNKRKIVLIETPQLAHTFIISYSYKPSLLIFRLPTKVKKTKSRKRYISCKWEVPPAGSIAIIFCTYLNLAEQSTERNFVLIGFSDVQRSECGSPVEKHHDHRSVQCQLLPQCYTINFQHRLVICYNFAHCLTGLQGVTWRGVSWALPFFLRKENTKIRPTRRRCQLTLANRSI